MIAALFAAVDNVTTGSNAITTITLSAAIVTFITGTAIPIVTGVITKLTAPSWVKVVVHFVLSTVAGVLTSSLQLDGTAVISKVTVLLVLSNWAIGLTTYQGALKKTVAPTINVTTRNVGIGDGPLVESKAKVDARTGIAHPYARGQEYPLAGPQGGH